MIYVIKRDGRKVPFDRTKIENAILKAFIILTNEELYPVFRLFFPDSSTAYLYIRRFFLRRSSWTDRGFCSSGIPKRAYYPRLP